MRLNHDLTVCLCCFQASGSRGWRPSIVCMSERYFETCKLRAVFVELEFVWIEINPVLSTDVEPVDSLVKATCQVVCPEKCVFSHFGFMRDVRDNLVKASGVSVAGRHVTLRCGFISVASPGGDKSGVVAIDFV